MVLVVLVVGKLAGRIECFMPALPLLPFRGVTCLLFSCGCDMWKYTWDQMDGIRWAAHDKGGEGHRILHCAGVQRARLLEMGG